MQVGELGLLDFVVDVMPLVASFALRLPNKRSSIGNERGSFLARVWVDYTLTFVVRYFMDYRSRW